MMTTIQEHICGCFCCASPIKDHWQHIKRLNQFTEEELEKFPLDYLIEQAKPMELLYAWHKLPTDYRNNFYLQAQLPCFVHFNRPDWGDHLEGPPPSQSRCYLCKFALGQF